MKATYPIDASRVFVTGLSGGGGMAALMLADWPDVFAGGAIIAGIPYGCATIKATTAEAQACTRAQGRTRTSIARRRRRETSSAAPTRGTPGRTRASRLAGDRDTVVSPDNEAELRSSRPTSRHRPDGDEQRHGRDLPARRLRGHERPPFGRDVHDHGSAARRRGRDHWPIDPNMPNGAKCGQAGSYIIDVGICSTYYAARFFGLDPSSPLPGSDGGTGSSGDGGGGTSGSSDGGVVIVPGGGGPDGGIAAVDAAPVPDDASPAAATDEDPGLPDNCAATASPSSPRGPTPWLAWGGAGLALLAGRRQRARRGR